MVGPAAGFLPVRDLMMIVPGHPVLPEDWNLLPEEGPSENIVLDLETVGDGIDKVYLDVCKIQSSF